VSKKIWIFAFEYAGIAKVGGLGEVSANQCTQLAGDAALDLEVFMPSYGKHRDLQEQFHFTPLLEEDGSKLILKGHFDPAYFGLHYGDQLHARSFTKYQSFTDIGYFEIEIWHGVVKGVSMNLLVGRNAIAARILNDGDVYNFSTLNAKLGLFSKVMREYMRYAIHKHPSRIPDIIHIHDHHPLGALLCCRQELNLVERDVRSLITMHLLTWPRRDLEFYWKSGVTNELLDIQVGPLRVQKQMTEIYEMCLGEDPDAVAPTLEKVGCVVADQVIAVSESFLHSDIIPNCGGDLIKWKADFTWNGCDWDFEKHKQLVWDRVKDKLPNLTLDTVRSWNFRKVFLEHILGDLSDHEPILPNLEIKSVIATEFATPPYHPDGSVDPFDSDGPLVLVTGRVSPQKGIEDLLAIIPEIVAQIPDVKFLFLMVPTPYALDDLRAYMEVARAFPDNIRFIFGLAGSIFLLAHLSADVYTCPSRWEPFGIVALEAMASRIPVVATYVGGLQESIVHLEDHPDTGTGLLCPQGDQQALKFALVSLLRAMQIAENKAKDPSLTATDVQAKLAQIVHPGLLEKVRHDLTFGSTVRSNAYSRVEITFRWAEVSKKLKRIYLF